jgi:hypothetical protein
MRCHTLKSTSYKLQDLDEIGKALRKNFLKTGFIPGFTMHIDWMKAGEGSEGFGDLLFSMYVHEDRNPGKAILPVG